MARLPLIDPNSDDADAAAVAALQSAGSSIHPHVYRAMANHPQILEAFLTLGNVAYFQNSLTAAQRELAYLTASVVNLCHY